MRYTLCVLTAVLFASATAAKTEPLCSAPASDHSPERTVGGIACCHELYPGKRLSPWEKDYLLELVGASPKGNCICEGNPAKPIKVCSYLLFKCSISSRPTACPHQLSLNAPVVHLFCQSNEHLSGTAEITRWLTTDSLGVYVYHSVLVADLLTYKRLACESTFAVRYSDTCISAAVASCIFTCGLAHRWPSCPSSFRLST